MDQEKDQILEVGRMRRDAYFVEYESAVIREVIDWLETGSRGEIPAAPLRSEKARMLAGNLALNYRGAIRGESS